MTILGKFKKKISEVLDYDVYYTDWFDGRLDTPVTAYAFVDSTNITVVSTALNGKVVKVTLSGGVEGGVYRVTTRLTTSTGIVRDADFSVTVKDA